MECYVKTADGTFHSSLGMQRPITVTEADSGGSPPEADIEITLSNFVISVEGEATPGEHTVAVHFEEHPEFGLGNDVHLVRLHDGMSLDEVVPWMDWMNLGGLRAPSPAIFLGRYPGDAGGIHSLLHRESGAGPLRLDLRIGGGPRDGEGIHRGVSRAF
jgi:hypothetical protein